MIFQSVRALTVLSSPIQLKEVGLDWITEMSGFTNTPTTKGKRFGLEKTTPLHMARRVGLATKDRTSTQVLLAIKKILRVIITGTSEKR
jgi:hypothetical protein